MKVLHKMWQFEKDSFHTPSAAKSRAREVLSASKLNISDYVSEVHYIRFTEDEADRKKMDTTEYYIADRVEIDKYTA